MWFALIFTLAAMHWLDPLRSITREILYAEMAVIATPWREWFPFTFTKREVRVIETYQHVFHLNSTNERMNEWREERSKRNAVIAMQWMSVIIIAIMIALPTGKMWSPRWNDHQLNSAQHLTASHMQISRCININCDINDGRNRSLCIGFEFHSDCQGLG